MRSDERIARGSHELQGDSCVCVGVDSGSRLVFRGAKRWRPGARQDVVRCDLSLHGLPRGDSDRGSDRRGIDGRRSSQRDQQPGRDGRSILADPRQNQTDLADIAAYIASFAAPPPPSGAVVAVEYYYADWNYYFETAFPDEIAGLDGGAFGGVWRRTGQTFYVWLSVVTASAAILDPQPSAVNPLAVPTCRFFSTTFAPKSSHFYTPFEAECEFVKTNPNWQFESIAFYIALAVDGVCPDGTIALYRLYNNGMGGAPNHRYTTDPTIFNNMQAAGWVFEGDLVTKVFACVPH